MDAWHRHAARSVAARRHAPDWYSHFTQQQSGSPLMSNPTQVALLAELFPAGLTGKRLHCLGAGGIGISAVIQLALEQGALVSGCDQAESSMFRFLARRGVPLVLGHDPAHLDGPDGAPVDLVVSAPAVAALNPDQAELREAERRGIPVVDWQALLGYFMRGRTGVSVAGVHGKGSTTALLGALAIAGGLDPTVEVGAVVPAWGSNVRPGQGALFINEADEWNYNFLHYHPRVVVLTAVEYDHPEFFSSYEAIRDAFAQFLRGMDLGAGTQPPPTLIYNADDPGCREMRAQLGADWPGVARGFSCAGAEGAYARASEVRVAGETSFRLELGGADLGRVTLQTPGAHNVANALAAAAAADVLGVPRAEIALALAAFAGLRRRFEISEDARGITYVDDYAHHPHAIALTLATARQRFPGRRLVAVFQPTLFTRLFRFLTPYSEAFDDADAVVIVETQPSRERDTGLVHGRDLVAKTAARPAFARHPDDVEYGGTFDETVATLRPRLRAGDVLMVMGSGPVNRIIPPLRDGE
jgi:UDP-N-acetylmuramate--alanine ligase